MSQFATAEKAYMSLGFLEHKGFFSRQRDSTLRNSYQTLTLEFHKVEDSVLNTDQEKYGLSHMAVEFEKLLGHLCGQLCQYLTAQIIETYSKSFHHPLLSSLRTNFIFECDIINHLLQAQILMSEWQYLPSLLELHQAHSKLNTWGATAQIKEHKKSTFGSSSKHGPFPQLYFWLLKYKAQLVSKFSLYFYDVLSKQSTPTEMKSLLSRTSDDFVTKIINFQKKTDATHISIVFDIQGVESTYAGPGYHFPGKFSEPPRGLAGFPAIFSYPGDKPLSHWPNVVMMISGQQPELHSQEKLNCLFDKSAQSTYFLTTVDTRMTMVVIFETKKGEKDSYINHFMSDLATQLKCTKLFSALKPGSKG
ncbi:hypothetical protein KUTeg_000202 [Tegillarca granosa]|uniref:Uncharacterized protein n=1 Tax=Tegillarca granosa TaxID=220873 RepID=A0ABQ9FZY6_TEGGR|nr:hypothetical protein KUTeg_000202 [Tegillarca granosa]